jgi:hypothetical protein
MVETKDKVVTVESLKAFHNYNQGRYMSTSNPITTGLMEVHGNVLITENSKLTGKVIMGSNVQFVHTGDGFNIEFLDEDAVLIERTEEDTMEETTTQTTSE